MTPRRGLVLDANILIRAAMGKRVRTLLEAYEDSAAFYAPDVCFDDAREYIPRLFGSRGDNPGTETKRFRSFSYADLIQRDKANLDIFWLRDDSLGDSSDLPDPAVLAAEIVEDLQAALDQFAQIAADLGAGERGAGTS